MIRLIYLLILTLLTSVTPVFPQDTVGSTDIENLQFTPMSRTGTAFKRKT